MAASETQPTAPEMRDAFGATLVELGAGYPDMLFLDADLHTSTKATQFRDAYRDRFYQIGIAEQNLFGIAAGLALEGYTPWPSTFAVFATRRALDQFAVSVCYPRLNVKVAGSYAGVPTSRAGASHNAVEDVAITRALPNLLVADPGTSRDLAAVMRTAMATDGPVYFRVARYAVPELFDEGHEFAWGSGETVRLGADVTLFGTGIMTSHNVRAAERLAEDGIDAEVVHLASIKPLDVDLVVASAAKTGCAVTAENASVNGGLGSAVCEALCDQRPVPVKRIGVRDRFIESGGIDELFALHRMRPEDIAEAAREAIAIRDGREPSGRGRS
ncbi:MAG: transketolase family protein [Spirochaetota bacterium]